MSYSLSWYTKLSMTKRLIRHKFLYLLFFLLVSPFSYSNEINKIEINGISSTSRGTILSYLPVEVGDNFDENISDLSLKRLYQTGLFEDIKISFLDNILKIIVTESPVIKYFEVKGFKNDRVLNEDALLLSIKDAKLSSGNIFKRETLEFFIKKLKEEYELSGHYQALLDIDIDKDADNRIGVVINIDEGEVARINSFKILGSRDFEAEELLDFFSIGEPDLFFINFFTEKDFYSQFEFDAGIQKLRSHYISSGYLKFEILEQKIDLSDSKEDINLTVTIHEGPKYSVGKISVTGDTLNISESQILDMLYLKSGDHFDNKKLIESLENVNLFYGNQGFANSTINASTTDNKQDKLVDILIDINVNNRVYLNRIIITGNTRTQDDVIRREINLLEGQRYIKSELDKSITNIKRLAFFSNVETKTSKVPNNIDKIDIYIEVDENKTGEFSIGLSQSNTTGAAFTLGVRERNFLGTGNTMNANLISSEAVEELRFQFVNPDFNGNKHSLGYGAFSKQVNSKYIDLASYTINEVGLNASYGIPISEYGKFTNGFRVSNVDLECGTIYSIYESAQCGSNQSITDFTYITSITENSLNDSTFPSDGRRNNLSLEFGLPFSDQKYYKLDMSHSSYYPMKNSLVGKLSTTIGLIDTYDDSSTPFYKKYFGGGSASVRGFDLNSLGSKYPNGSVKGGEVSILASSSIFSPLPVKDSKNMRIGAFIDAGAITETVTNFDFNDFRASSGVAFTWVTPIGPIGVNLTKPLIQKTGDSVETFSFTLGSSF